MKIGMYDSGIGGLTVAKEVINKIKNTDIIYIADNYNVPYGDKPAEQIKSFSCGISKFLIDESCDTICIACNMSTAVSLEKIKENYPNHKIYGTIEFGAKEAVKYSNNIGVIATFGTVQSEAYTKYIKSLDENAIITEEACPEFVPIVESDKCDTSEAFSCVKKHIENILQKQKIGALVLGCTHYPYLINQIKKVLPCDVKIINPATAMAEFLASEKIYSNEKERFFCYATENCENVSKVCCETLNKKIKCLPLKWTDNKLYK